MDKNKLIQLIGLSAIMLIYLYFVRPKPVSQPTQAIVGVESVTSDKSTVASTIDSPFAAALQGEEKYITVENAWLKVILSTKGGTIQKVMLKQYKKNGQELVLLDAQSSHMGLVLPYKQTEIETKSLFFETASSSIYQLQSGDQATIVFRLMYTPEQYIEQQFDFSGNSYQVGYTWRAVGMEPYLTKSNKALFCWHMDMRCLETDYKADADKSTINYCLEDYTFNNLKASSTKVEQKQLDKPLKWVSIKQRFFSSAIIAENAFATGNLVMEPVSNSTEITKMVKLSLVLSEEDKTKGKGRCTFFFGPNDYKVLKGVTKDFEQNLPLGWPIVKWVNRGLIIPLFSFLEKHFSNYGFIIFLLVIVIKLLLAPLSYKSFVAMAKMKMIKPELDKIKQRYSHSGEAQKAQVAFYRELGINPLSGCVPVLLQAPILLAMFNFLPNAIALRQASFLWAHDLSTYDSIFQLPFAIPLYGDHVSLFTLLMMLSTILYAWISNQNSPTEGPMKGLAYLMPLAFMFVLNSFPAGLSFYYFVSNVMSFLQQTLTKYFVNETAIRDKLLVKQQKIKKGVMPSFQDKITATIQENNKKRK